MYQTLYSITCRDMFTFKIFIRTTIIHENETLYCSVAFEWRIKHCTHWNVCVCVLLSIVILIGETHLNEYIHSLLSSIDCSLNSRNVFKQHEKTKRNTFTWKRSWEKLLCFYITLCTTVQILKIFHRRIMRSNKQFFNIWPPRIWTLWFMLYMFPSAASIRTVG